MSQYVRLFTPSDYSPPRADMIVSIVLIVLIAIALISSIVFICMGRIRRRREWATYSEAADDDVRIGECLIVVAMFLALIGSSVFSAGIADATQYKGTRKGYVADDNVALVERSYKISNMKTEQKGVKSVEEFLDTENDPVDVRYAKVIAQSDDAKSIRHLTLQIDKDNRLRVYDDTGNQHLIVPTSSVGKDNR